MMVKLSEYKKQLKASFSGDKPRERALDKAISLGLPHAHMENWRYSNLKQMGDFSFEPTSPKTNIKNADIPAKITSWPRLVFLNGKLSESHSEPLPTGLKTNNNVKDSGKQDATDNVFEYLNMALNNGGVNLAIPKNIKTEGLELLFLFDGQDKQAAHIRNNIHLERGASLSIFTNYSCHLGNLGWVDVSNNIAVDKGASLRHYSDISSPKGRFINIRDNASLNGGTYENHSLLMSSTSARHEVEFSANNEGSQALINGAFLGGEGETLDTLTTANHLVANCNSEQFFKGVAARGGKTAFQGKVIVEKDAQLTVANQSCKNIVLDGTSEANVKPELLIYADDVKCAHGTTVGELDEKALFYLEQRGITPAEAKAILINAFLEEILDKMPNIEIQTCFRDKIAQWMGSKK